MATDGISQNLVVYIAGHRPIQVPINGGYSAFHEAVSRVLIWSDLQFLHHRPASQPRAQLIWQAISTKDDYLKLLNPCSHTGVLVKVVENSWFQSDAEDELSSIQNTTFHTNLYNNERPINNATWEAETPAVEVNERKV